MKISRTSVCAATVDKEHLSESCTHYESSSGELGARSPCTELSILVWDYLGDGFTLTL